MSVSFSASSSLSCSNSARTVFIILLLGWAGWRFFRTRDMSVRDMTGEFSIAYVTVPSREAGKAIAADIIEKKLAACVNIIPGVESLYWWEGKMESSNELMMMIKTRTSLVPQLVERVKAMHEYDVCEVITSPIDAGNPAYMKWLDESTAKV
mmetsp:Transcript_35779/g.93263  ORF Transcript_35779/g.93263 Transcript_35779/m.93263 type:complete len:152 (-) Transcript_35779:99-554(-)